MKDIFDKHKEEQNYLVLTDKATGRLFTGYILFSGKDHLILGDATRSRVMPHEEISAWRIDKPRPRDFKKELVRE